MVWVPGLGRFEESLAGPGTGWTSVESVTFQRDTECGPTLVSEVP